MKSTIRCMLCFCIVTLGSIVSAETDQNLLKAQIGIKVVSEQDLYPANSNNRVQVGDKLQVYIVPRFDAYIYVVQSNQESAIRLDGGTTEKTGRRYPLRLPLPSDQNQLFETEPFHIIKSSEETITIICSPDKLVELEELFNDEEIPYAQWQTLEQTLQKSRLELGTPLLKPLNIAGTARSTLKDDPFLDELKIFSGESLVIKRYKFRAISKK